MINTKIEITTPPGKEEFVLFVFKNLFLRISNVWKAETYTDEETHKIYLEVNLTPRQYVSVLRNVSLVKSQFEVFWNSKFCQSTIKGKPEDEVEELRKSLIDNTKIRIVNSLEATELLNEYYENKQLTFWEKVKLKFKKEKKEI